LIPASSGESTSISKLTGANTRSAPFAYVVSSAVAYLQAADGRRSDGASMILL
jgi:hypothetical protein